MISRAPVFDAEAYLVADLVSILPHPLVNGRPWAVATEVAVGKRVADVVVAAWQSFGVPSRALSVHESVLVASLLQVGPQTLGELGQLGSDWCDRARSAAEALLGDGLLERRRGNKVGLSSEWQHARPVRIVAIEAKLHDWREALTQAERYFSFADESYVALPRPLAARVRQNAEMLGEFTRAGIGLLAVDPGSVRRYAVSSRRAATGWQREFVGSRLSQRRRSHVGGQ